MKRALIWTTLFCLCLVSPTLAQSDSSRSAPTRTVSGTRIGHYKDGPAPIDLSIRTVAAYVPNALGGYQQIVGTGTAAGTFTIPNVPYQPYLLQLGNRYIWTRNTIVNADFDAFYRSTRAVADPSTTLTFDLTNLTPWQSADVLEVVDPDTSAFDLYSASVGQTKFTGTFPYYDYLSDATQGDQTLVLQLATQPVGGYPFVSATRYLPLSNLTEIDSADTTLAGWLRPIQQNKVFRANIKGADLAAQALAANPLAALTSTMVALDVFPGDFSRGQTTSTPDLVAYDLNSEMNLLTVNADLGTVKYGNPFPTNFPLFVVYQYNASTSYVAPGATSSVALATYTYGYTPALPTATSPIRPMVGVVTNPSVSSADFFTERTGIGLTPTLTWTPPTTGIANLYIVGVYQLLNDGGNTDAVRIATIQTQRSSITLPPGLLVAGQSYVFQITTGYRPGVDVVSRPYTTGPVNASADVISAMMQP